MTIVLRCSPGNEYRTVPYGYHGSLAVDTGSVQPIRAQKVIILSVNLISSYQILLHLDALKMLLAAYLGPNNQPATLDT